MFLCLFYKPPLYVQWCMLQSISFQVNTRNGKTTIMKAYGLPPMENKKRQNKILLLFQKHLCLCRLMCLHLHLALIVMKKHKRLPHGACLTEAVKSVSRALSKLMPYLNWLSFGWYQETCVCTQRSRYLKHQQPTSYWTSKSLRNTIHHHCIQHPKSG